MQFAHVFAGVPVADLDSALRWYERLLGRAPDMIPHRDEAVWHLTSDASIYVVVDPARAGTALLTLAVGDLERDLARVAEHGIPTRRIEARGSQPAKATLTDPAGNLISVFEAPAGSPDTRAPGAGGERLRYSRVMNPDDLRRLGALGSEVRVASGQMLIERGQYGAGLFVILEGTVEVEASEGTKDLGPGAVVGERALLSAPGARTARVRATSDLRVLAVDRLEIERLCADDPDFASRLRGDESPGSG